MSDDEATETVLSYNQKLEIAKWFLLNSPAGEIQYVAKDIKAVLKDETVYNDAAADAFPLYNKSHMICLQLPNRGGDVLVTSFGEVSEKEYLDPRTAQVAIVDHVKQTCVDVRPANDEELPSAYIEEYRCALDAEIVNNGSWRSIWNIVFKDELQIMELEGKMQVGAHYFEEGNVQLDAKHECKDTTIFQSPDDSAVSVTSIIRHHETEYLNSLQTSYSYLPDSTFKDLRRKLPVTRTLFPWHNTMQFSLTRDISKELGIGK